MLHLTDPTYLRYIVDGLHSQSIQQENLAALPQGLIGIYDEVLLSEQNLQERGRFLEFFSVWALLKKEVSATLVSSLLNWPEQEVIDALATHTKWFNSPASGTYILYHERLRTYLLSKITSNQLKQTNQKIIESCQHALELKKGDEWEIYALEHLPSHLLITAMQDEEQGASFRKLVYDTSYWNRQLEISKGYDWSKKMLNLAMVWAAKQNTDELIECALNKIDLHYMEQNDAPRIVEMVAQNDLETALQRIESFGGNDKEGLQRKFTLYMLCLMELTLLDSKDKPFRKSAIEKLLNHLDENIPVDHSLLKWNDFFPSYLMFQMACEWAELGLDYLRVYKRTDKWESDWIEDKGPYASLQFQVLLFSSHITFEDYAKSTQLAAISIEMAKQGSLEIALNCISEIYDKEQSSRALIFISREFAKQGKLEVALELARSINVAKDKSIAIAKISTVIPKINNEVKKNSLMQEAFEYADCIKNIWTKSSTLATISIELAIQGEFELALQYAKVISNDWNKINALSIISEELAKQQKQDEAKSLMMEVLEYTYGIDDDSTKSNLLSDLSLKITVFENNEMADYVMKNAIECALNIFDEKEKSIALNIIFCNLAKQEKIEEAYEIMNEAIQYALYIRDDIDRYDTLEEIASNLYLFEFNLALVSVSKIDNKNIQDLAIKKISNEWSVKGKIQEAASILMLGLVYQLNIRSDFSTSHILLDISKNFFINGKIEKAFLCSSLISPDIDRYDKNKTIRILNRAIIDFAVQLAIEQKTEKSLEIARMIKDSFWRNVALLDISNVLVKYENLVESYSIVQEVLLSVSEISPIEDKCHLLIEISVQLSYHKKFEEALSILYSAIKFAHEITFFEKNKWLVLVNISKQMAKIGKIEESFKNLIEINNLSFKSYCFILVSNELDTQGKSEESSSIMQKALECARGISNAEEKSNALLTIIREIVKQGKLEEVIKLFQESLECANRIVNPEKKSKVLVTISTELTKHGKLEEGAMVIQEALECARDIQDVSEMNKALIDISTELSKEGNYDFSERIGLEVNQVTERYNSWKIIANQQKDQLGLAEALINKSKFQSQEAQTYYLKGWAESITIEDISDELAHKAIQALKDDSNSLEHILQVYAQHELFFGNPSQEKINRLNKTLNLQWALDIIAQFPEE